MSFLKNQLVDLIIDDITHDGNGVAHVGGQVFFVPGTVVGDEIRAHILKVTKNICYAKIDDIIKPSRDRIAPECAGFLRCGSCTYINMSYEAEFSLKKAQTLLNLKRIGRIEPEDILSLPAVSRIRYRNKGIYPVRLENGNVKVGFYSRHSHRIAGCEDCLLAPAEFSTILAEIRRFIKEKHIPVYDEQTHKGLVRHIYLRKAFSTGELMVCLVINGRTLPHSDELITRLTRLDSIVGIVFNINTKMTNVILGKECRTLWGKPYITDILCGKRFNINPLSFYQVNPVMTERLYETAAELLMPDADDTLLDLYCGIGTIGLSMSDKVKHVTGVEIVPEAVRDAENNAKENGIVNAEFICADAENGISGKYDSVVLDPPRSGCTGKLLYTITTLAPKKILMISCNSATAARDAAILCEQGYRVERAAVVDMFPGCAHCELILLFTRK